MEKEVAAMKRRLYPHSLRGLISISLTPAERDGMAPGERIVEDYCDDENGNELIMMERITDDPADKGKDYPHGTWDREYWEGFPPQIDGIVLRKKRRSIQPEEGEAVHTSGPATRKSRSVPHKELVPAI